MPEIFNQASTFLLFLWFLNTVDPGLKIAGVTRRWESKFFALKQFRPLVEPFRGDG